MTQAQLAERVAVSIETIGKIERGIAAPSFDTAEKIAVALNIAPSALFGAQASARPRGERGKLLARIETTLADMNEDQLSRVARMLEAFLGR
jgi:transcriptional regulator with XRE-family HTH domain